LDDNDENDDSQAQSGYLESLKGRFSFDQVPNKVEFCGISVKNNQIDDLLRYIAQNA